MNNLFKNLIVQLQYELKKYCKFRNKNNFQANLATSPPRPYSRYVPNPSSVNSYNSRGSQSNLEQLQKAFIQSNQASYALKQPKEVIGSTLPTETPYYGPQIDRHIGQNIFGQNVRHREESPKPPLPVDDNPDNAISEGLKKVSAFADDSGKF